MTFGDGSVPIRHAASRLVRQAEASGWFASCIRFDFDKLRFHYPDFWRKYGRFMLENRRGAGYWIWKPFLISKIFDDIRNGEYLMFADAGCEIGTGDLRAFESFLPLEIDKDLTITVLPNWYTISRWTNLYCRQLLDHMDYCRYLPQMQSGLLAFKKTVGSHNLIRKWLFWSMYDNSSLLIDRVDDLEDADFYEHRHDQSVLTLILYELERKKLISIKRVDSEVAESREFVIPTLRNRSPISTLDRSRIRGAVYRRLYWKTMKIQEMGERRRLARLRATLSAEVFNLTAGGG